MIPTTVAVTRRVTHGSPHDAAERVGHLPADSIRTEIRFLEVGDYFTDDHGRLFRKVGRRFPWDSNSRLGFKHLAVRERPFVRGKLYEFRAHQEVLAAVRHDERQRAA